MASTPERRRRTSPLPGSIDASATCPRSPAGRAFSAASGARAVTGRDPAAVAEVPAAMAGRDPDPWAGPSTVSSAATRYRWAPVNTAAGVRSVTDTEIADGSERLTLAERTHGLDRSRASARPGENHSTFVPIPTPARRRTVRSGNRWFPETETSRAWKTAECVTHHAMATSAATPTTVSTQARLDPVARPAVPIEGCETEV